MPVRACSTTPSSSRPAPRSSATTSARRKDKALRALIFALFPHPRRLRLLRGPLRVLQRTGLDRALRRTGLLERMAPQLAAMESLAPRLGRPEPLPERITATGERRAVVGLLTGCVQGAFFPGVNSATARVLQAEGCDVVVPPKQGCCGALSVHNGRETEAQGFARALVDAFEAAGVERVVVNAAGLRLDDEGVRRAAGRRPGVRRARARRSPRRSATSPRSSTSSARSPPGTRSR